ncbi:MAG: hypothetical protein VB092_04860, partial [Oscillospiraceae bacterium]|nr:hypothetical protein [Oscillospiraceae bacterium]
AGGFAAAKTMLNSGFANFEHVQLHVGEENFTPIKVKLGVEQYCEYAVDMPQSLIVERGKSEAISYEVTMEKSVTAPVEQGQAVGAVRVYCDGQEIGNYPVTAVETIARIDFKTGLGLLFDALTQM